MAIEHATEIFSQVKVCTWRGLMSIHVVSHMRACSVNRDLIHDKESLEGHSVETVATGWNAQCRGLLYRWRWGSVQRTAISQSFTRWRNPFVTTEPVVPVTISGLLAHRLQSVSSAETNFGGHKLKRHCDVETATRTDIKADASVLAVSMWQSTGRESTINPNCTKLFSDLQWQQKTSQSDAFLRQPHTDIQGNITKWMWGKQNTPIWR